MLIYAGTKSDFMIDTENDRLETKLYENIKLKMNRTTGLISGYGWNGKGNVVIVELKQWEKLTAIDGQDAIVETYTGGANRRVVHPCYQA